MPIDRNSMRRDAGASLAFLNSRNGVALHELGHYAGATSGGLVGGHIIIGDKVRSGAFVPHGTYRRSLMEDPKRYRFTLAAAAITEMFFCDRTEMTHCKIDVEQFVAIDSPAASLTLEDCADVIRAWRKKYWNRIQAQSEIVQRNFDALHFHMNQATYLWRGYHVVPTSALTPHCAASAEERNRERELTESQADREQALSEFLGARAVGSGSCGFESRTR